MTHTINDSDGEVIRPKGRVIQVKTNRGIMNGEIVKETAQNWFVRLFHDDRVIKRSKRKHAVEAA